MSTLKEILDNAMFYDPADRRAIESWAYGQKGKCPRCEGDGSGVNDPFEMIPCPTCNGTGTIRKPGLVERITSIVPNSWEGQLAALREELGVK